MLILVSCGITILRSVGVGLVTGCLFFCGLRHSHLPGFLLELLGHLSMINLAFHVVDINSAHWFF